MDDLSGKSRAMSVDPQLDHVVITTHDLDRTVDALDNVLGVRPVEGGRHADRGSRNFLLGLGPHSYLEILSKDETQPEPLLPRMLGLDELRTQSRLVTWAIAPSDFDASRHAAAEAGIDLGSVSTLSRNAPDGEIRVSITERPGVAHDGVIPFLVDWGNGANPGDDLPGVQLLGLNATHPEPEKIVRELSALKVQLDVEWGVTPCLELVLQSPNGIMRIR